MTTLLIRYIFFKNVFEEIVCQEKLWSSNHKNDINILRKTKKCLDIYYFAYWNTSIYVSHQNLLEFLLFQFDLENLLSDSPTGVMERNSVKVFYIFVLHVYLLCSDHDYIAGFCFFGVKLTGLCLISSRNKYICPYVHM